jgi:diphthine synthase
MALFMIGIGLSDEKDITLRGFEAVKSCTHIFLETYTSALACSLEDLERLYQKKVIPVDREFVEAKSHLILEHALHEHVAFLVIGDVFCATTHMDLYLAAQERHIEVHVIHNASVITAIGSVGLEIYKFGKITSIPFPAQHYEPTSYYTILAQNKSIGAHSLILLDLRPDQHKFMTVREACALLLQAEKTHQQGIIHEATRAIGIAALGRTPTIVDATIKTLMERELKGIPQALILPGPLHFVEEQALEQWKTL